MSKDIKPTPKINMDFHFRLSKIVFPTNINLLTESLPSQFNWKTSLPNLISYPENQGACGSCYIFAMISSISDNFAVQTGWNPNLSYTYAFNITDDSKGCSGGNPGYFLSKVVDDNIKLPTIKCIDYSWCNTNFMCSTLNLGFDMSNNIPSQGCYYPNNSFYGLTLKSAGTIHPTYDINLNKSVVDSIKLKIHKNGPIVALYPIFKNFQTFFDNANLTDGIYFENAIYSSFLNIGMNVKFDDSVVKPDNYIGVHAISIIGWGVKKTNVGGNKQENVEYWICRNSWGQNSGVADITGVKGYFYMAMYPWNNFCQFSFFSMELQNRKIPLGQIAIFDINPVPYIMPNNYYKKSNYSGYKDRNDSFYEGDMNANPMIKNIGIF
jgi:C1A family cysteine protease